MSEKDTNVPAATSLERPANTVCVTGLGYVGLPVAVAFDRAGWNVVGYDVSERTVDALRNGNRTSRVVSEQAVVDSDIHFTTDPGFVSDATFVVVTVPTPTDDRQMPDLDYVEAAAETIGANLSPGTTVILESTVFPGATREVLIPALERTSELTAGEEFDVGYSPERISPGDSTHGIEDVVKVVSGLDDEVSERIRRLYDDIVDAGIHVAPSIEVAEMMKVFENVQRDVNIALVNELAVVSDHLGLNTEDVLEAAGTKWNFQEYSPGLVGGHCIPVDPTFYVHSSEREGFSPKLVQTAREMNEYMAKYTAELTVHGLNDCGKVLRDSRVLVLGLSYKANVGDVRNTKVSDVIAELERYDISVTGYDPVVENHQLRSTFDVPILDELSFEGFDGVILAVGHDEFASLSLDTVESEMNESPLFVDVDAAFTEDEVTKHGFAYDRL